MARTCKYLAILILFLLSSSEVSKSIWANETNYEIGRLTLQDIITNPKIFDYLYCLRSQEKVSIYGREIKLSLYNIKNDSLNFYENIPKSVIMLTNDNREIKLPIGSYWPSSNINYVIPKTKNPILCIQNPMGGNGWNSNPYYVISLESKTSLQNLGKASGIDDLNGDGIDELIKYDDIWELGLGFLCHTESPGAVIILKIDENILVDDISNNIDYYKKEIVKIDAEIKSYPKRIPKDMNTRLLSLILQKFLIYRLLGEMEEGWKIFNKDITHYDNKFFYLHSGQRKTGIEKISIQEIKQKMVKSLKQKD